ncbi:MAG: FtsX-like permease family protein, partial [Muribaculaceae bacterium]|nr:FtsX-like permease family protein [Muribaculaceae bacterium]
GIGNIMWVIVKERTQEIGIRRAIGAKPRDIIAQILSEGVALTAVAGIAGISFATIVLAAAQALTANEISTPRFQMNLHQALIIFAMFAVLGTLAGLIPAIKAMRIKPVEAMNDK